LLEEQQEEDGLRKEEQAIAVDGGDREELY
jgi:hypothetical protein